MATQPQSTTRTFPTNLRVITRRLDGTALPEDRAISYDVKSWSEGVDELRAYVAKRFGTPTCLVTLRPLPTAEATKEEHVVLQGLGTRWLKFPRGFVSDRVNNAMSAAEKAFQQKGLLGSLRPLYVTERKKVSFKDVYGRDIDFEHDPENGHTISVVGEGGPPVAPRMDPDGASSGEFTFDLVIDEPSPTDVSRAIHKIAYLALCVMHPALALSPLLDDARAFIRDGVAEQFRPYAEAFKPGAWPGFHLMVQVEAAQIDQSEAAAHRVLVTLRLHHVSYTFSLAGEPLALPDEADVVRHDSPDGPRQRRRKITWRFGRHEHVGE